MRKSLTVTDTESEVRIPAWMAPSGWFVVGWSHDLAPGDIKPLKVFGQELVLYRSTAGGVCCLEATCQHLGAHLGYGGKVVNDCIVCPFHGWTWGPDGQNVAVPEGRTSKRRIEPWPVCERNGIIYLWHDVAGQPPTWSIPDLFEDLRDEYPTGEYWDLATAASTFDYGDLSIEPRVVAENIVDPIHFRYVHHTRDLPTLVDYHVTDASFTTKLRVHSRGKRRVGAAAREDTVTLKQWGVGMAYTRFSGRDNTHSVISTTPVDAQTSTLRQTLFIEKVDGESDGERSARIKAIESVFPEDLAIWQHQRFIEPPSLQTQEAKMFRMMRRWAQTFQPKPGEYGSLRSDRAAPAVSSIDES
ncbi:Rieske 2Fe-2S domain-containing protein [Mycobacterium sp. MMS18-G62]